MHWTKIGDRWINLALATDAEEAMQADRRHPDADKIRTITLTFATPQVASVGDSGSCEGRQLTFAGSDAHVLIGVLETIRDRRLGGTL